MAKNHISTGKQGEQIACQYLLSRGYRIVDRNWRYSRAEVDIIAYDVDTLVFVEVKTKSYIHYGKPEESVSAFKERLYFDAANVYMELHEHEDEIRFDIIGVVIDNEGKATLDHIEDAFFHGL